MAAYAGTILRNSHVHSRDKDTTGSCADECSIPARMLILKNVRRKKRVEIIHFARNSSLYTSVQKEGRERERHV